MLSIYLLYSVSVFKFDKIYMRKHYISDVFEKDGNFTWMAKSNIRRL